MNNLVVKKRNELRKTKKKGFTLVELIIVIGLIALLAAMAIPKFSEVRLDAKISNDAAAAKNIHTQIATLVANGTVKGVQASGTAIPAGALKNLDGKAASGSAEALSGKKFTFEMDANEDIKVSVDTHELYPDKAGTGKTSYIAAAKA